MERKRIALSWSGGKDSCLALHKLVSQNCEIACLVTTAPRETGLTFAHGEKLELIHAQGRSLGIPVQIINCSYETYSNDFRDELLRLKELYVLDGIAFGDLYLEEHKKWGEKLANETNMEAIYPLWMKQSDAFDALSAFIDSGYQAKVIRVMHGKLPDEWLGKQINSEFLKEIKDFDVCPMGESGEYHTFVFDGPLFREKLDIIIGEKVKQDYSTRLEVSLNK